MKVFIWFQSLAFKFNLRHYSEVSNRVRLQKVRFQRQLGEKSLSDAKKLDIHVEAGAAVQAPGRR